MNEKVYGGIEAGGTKFVCMVGNGPEHIIATERFPTTNPEETLSHAITFFKQQTASYDIAALGVACFGPLDLDSSSSTFGHITTTPKPGWANTNITGILNSALQVPVLIDTDVNAAALAEYHWGSDRLYDPLLYFTIGTGIGGGCIVHGKSIHGLVHPEMGHLRIPHDREADPFPGTCPYHGDCFEGLACGLALQQRWGERAEKFSADHPAWDLEATYLALALMNVIVTFSPRKIVLGGGVMSHIGLFSLVRGKVQALLNNYVRSPVLSESIENYITPPALGTKSGVLGAIALCKQVVEAL